MLAQINRLADEAYDLQEALVAANITIDDLNKFREISEENEVVPKTMLDKQVNFISTLVACDYFKSNFNFSYCPSLSCAIIVATMLLNF